MAIITTKIESKITLPEHEVIITPEGADRTDVRGSGEMDQTKIQGIMAPLLFMNGIAVDYLTIHYFKLDWKGHVPTIAFCFDDRKSVFSGYAKPGLTNEIQVQILPPYDNAYKKVNLLFYVTSITINGGVVEGTASYKVMEFVQTQYESLGQKTTYELCEYVAEKTGMGLASNFEECEDKRYMQAREQSYSDMLGDEINISLADQTMVQDWWVDLWNNLTLCNMYDRYENVDDEADMKVWIREGQLDATKGSEEKTIAALTLFTNSPHMQGSELEIHGYDQHTIAGGGYAAGTSKATCSYVEATHSWNYTYSSDGDVTGDEFLNSEYGGEIYGDYNETQSQQNREMFYRKMNSETLSVYTKHPLLGIIRGDQVRVLWYDAGGYQTMVDEDLQDQGMMMAEDDIRNGWIAEFDKIDKTENDLHVNYQVSGQYTVIGVDIIWQNEEWDVEYLLARPARNKIDVLPINGE